MGKTTLLENLRQRSFKVVPETARELIKAQQAIDGDALPWKNRKRYMELMFEGCKARYERTLQNRNPDEPVFFDRGFLDALCYASLEGLPIDQELKTYAETHRYHSQVFILPPWKDIYHTDTERTQDWNESVFTYNKMIQNLIWATAYNVVAIPLAAGVLYSSGFVMGPAVGAVFMSLSTIIVAINAQLLRRKIGR